MTTSVRSGQRVLLTVVAACLVAIPAVAVYSTGVSDDKVKWTQTVIDDSEHFYVCDLAVGSEYMYGLGWVYPGDTSLMFRSSNNGKSWLGPVAVWSGGYPGMCVYDGGTGDVLLLAGSPGVVKKSVDHGLNWTSLSTLPYSELVWSTLAIGTNASWFGGPADDDIYVVGGLGYGSYQTAFTVSHDGGLTWEAPRIVAPTSYQNGWCEMVGDGTRLYVFYTLFGLDPMYGTLCVRASSDWGATWTDQRTVATSYFDNATGVLLKAGGVQYLDGEKAFLTMADCTYIGQEDLRTGRWGYFSFSDMTYTELGNASWSCGDFAGKVLPNGKLIVIYDTYLDGNIFPLMSAVTTQRVIPKS